MKILGIETSCDETSASLVEVKRKKIKVLSNIVSSQIKIHAPFGGVVPSLAAREHVNNIQTVLKASMAGLDFDDLDLISVTSGPGLISSLLVGTAFAKTLAWRTKKPLTGVNHIEGHIYSSLLKPVGEESQILDKKELFPAICLVVSGGHTQLILMSDYGKYELLGETRDDAAGEAFDKIARTLGLGYPGGPIISKMSESGHALKYLLPSPMINSKNYEFSFAGLKTAVLYLVKNIKDKENKLNEQTIADISASSQKAIVDVLIAKTVRAAKSNDAKSVMLSGGVSANKLLRQRLKESLTDTEIEVLIPEMSYTTDNAAMIAVAGYFSNLNKKSSDLNWQSVKADSNWEMV